MNGQQSWRALARADQSLKVVARSVEELGDVCLNHISTILNGSSMREPDLCRRLGEYTGERITPEVLSYLAEAGILKQEGSRYRQS